ncbi:hypothetical protein [Synechocystis sp. PCC 7509]|uniref:hypothetical protein n=1 Tax=Synechocystis sp. PCC 7509 TaxID=927677 RepID=UPI00130D7001|nr:hypothetical protein [Synechocystis sp. PCC 7509]
MALNHTYPGSTPTTRIAVLEQRRRTPSPMRDETIPARSATQDASWVANYS